MKRLLMLGMFLFVTIQGICAVAGETRNGITTGVKINPARNVSTSSIVWTSGELADHISGNQTLNYTTDSITAPAQSRLEFTYGIWDTPVGILSVSLNGTFLGSVLANQGYIKPGPQYKEWAVGGILQDGVNTIKVEASPSTGEAIVGAFTIYEGASASLRISPPSGDYVITQGFDLTLIVETPGLSVVGGSAILDGSDVTAALAACIIPGTLVLGGQALRCPGLTGATFGTGIHFLEVTLDLNDGSSVSDAAIWEVIGNTEP